ncbi:MAG: AAA family ATPase, partial [Planctomycetes bacterium]|nr:AAA family ATPase [Planctomycetota bacterium]
NFSYAYLVTGNKPVEIPISGRKRITRETYTEPTLIEKTAKLLSWLRSNAFPSNSAGWFAVGYGPFRRLTREHRILIPSLSPPNRASNFLTQFNDDEPLSSFERWMVYLEYRMAKDPEDQLAQKMREIGESAITELLPGQAKISEVTKDGLILFELEGQTVPTTGMSDGFRSIIALAGDLIWRLLQTYPDMDDPTQANGVVLIDELDIHLHPVWQRHISEWLQKTFPNLQFIVATHSPFIAIGAGEKALTLKLTMDSIDGTVKVSQVEDISAYDVEHTLRSPAFGLISTYSPQTQKKIEQYHQLSYLEELDREEKREYRKLSEFMQYAMPVDESPQPDSIEDKMDKFLAKHSS